MWPPEQVRRQGEGSRLMQTGQWGDRLYEDRCDVSGLAFLNNRLRDRLITWSQQGNPDLCWWIYVFQVSCNDNESNIVFCHSTEIFDCVPSESISSHRCSTAILSQDNTQFMRVILSSPGPMVQSWWSCCLQPVHCWTTITYPLPLSASRLSSLSEQPASSGRPRVHKSCVQHKDALARLPLKVIPKNSEEKANQRSYKAGNVCFLHLSSLPHLLL